MLHRVFSLISTLVLIPVLVFAAPEDPAPNLDQNPTPVTETGDLYKLKPVDVSQPGPQKTKNVRAEKEYLYPYQSSMGPRLGVSLSNKSIEIEEFVYLVGFYYMFPSISSQHIEAGADLLSNRVGRVNGAYKWIFNGSEKFRPFTKAGLSLLLESEKGLGNVIDYHQYSARIGGGVEDLLQDPASLRWDLEFTVGFQEVGVNLVFGYSWGW
jgi:hypothetical protein